MRHVVHTGSVILLLVLQISSSGAQPGRPVTNAQFETWMTELSNWGRWGADDQRGALNLITPAKVKEALALVQDGHAVSLAHDVETEAAVDNPAPFVHEMVQTGLDGGDGAADFFRVQFHGLAHTHLDALGHFFHKGKMYNGFAQEEVTEQGAMKNSILNMKSGIMTRGILVDIPALRGIDYLEPGDAIYPEELDAWEQRTGITISAGDAVFIRTGRWLRRRLEGPWGAEQGLAGLHPSVAVWLHARDIALLGSDLASDQNPSQVEGEPGTPIHKLMIVAMGVAIFDACDLEALSRAAVARDRYEFLLTAAPLAVPGGTGSPLNPIATF